jgi:hypothetical protein
MNTTKQLLSVSATLLCASAIVPGAVLADSPVERGTYTGKSTQPATDGGKPFAGAMKIALGYLSDPARVTRIELRARLTCADGTTQDARYAKVIAFGPQLNAKGRFTHRDGGLVVKGKFGRKGTARGSFSYTLEDCSVTGARWSAKER